MRLKIRYLTIFTATFISFFVLLNGRYIYANVRFWTIAGTLPEEFNQSLKVSPSAITDTENAPEKPTPLPNKAELVIDELGISTPIIFGTGDNSDKIYDSLEDGVVHYSNTPKPGSAEGGLSLILGHSSAYPWYKGKYGSVFALLGKLKIGDKFYIKYEDGRVFNYQVKQAIVFNPFSANGELDNLQKEKTANLVLVSCWPVGTNYRRIAVQAGQL